MLLLLILDSISNICHLIPPKRQRLVSTILTDSGLIVKGYKKKLYVGAPEVVFFPIFLHMKTENNATLAVSCARFILLSRNKQGIVWIPINRYHSYQGKKTLFIT